MTTEIKHKHLDFCYRVSVETACSEPTASYKNKVHDLGEILTPESHSEWYHCSIAEKGF